MKFIIYFKYLYKLSDELNNYKNNDKQFIEAIIDLDKEDLLTVKNTYQGKKKINEIRYQVVNKILDDGTLSLQNLEKIKGEVNDKYQKDILNSWMNFSILF